MEGSYQCTTERDLFDILEHGIYAVWYFPFYTMSFFTKAIELISVSPDR